MLASRCDTCDADEGRSRFIGLEAIKNECVPPGMHSLLLCVYREVYCCEIGIQ